MRTKELNNFSCLGDDSISVLSSAIIMEVARLWLDPVETLGLAVAATQVISTEAGGSCSTSCSLA